MALRPPKFRKSENRGRPQRTVPWRHRADVSPGIPAARSKPRPYLYQMQEQLEYILSNIDTENLSDDLKEKLNQSL